MAQTVVPGLERRLKAHLLGEVEFDAFTRGRYATDASHYQIMPLGVVAPRSVKEAQHALSIAREEGVSVLARGAGTSQAGQAVNSSLVIDCSKYLDHLIELDVPGRRCVVEPGIVLDELNRRLKPHGLWFPVDISTASRATIAGMVGNNACGARSLRYGNTRENVVSIDAVLADGTVAHFGPLARDLSDLPPTSPLLPLARDLLQLAAREADEIEARFPKVQRRVGGYNLDSLAPGRNDLNLAHILVGSEGTLAFSTRIELKLSPVLGRRAVGACHFGSFFRAMDAAQHIVKLAPIAVELIDHTMLGLARDIAMFRPTIDAVVRGDPEAVLFVEFAEDDQYHNLRRLMELRDLMGDLGFGWNKTGAKWGGVVEIFDPKLQAAITETRTAGLNIMMSMKEEGKPVSFVEDCAVPLEHLAEYTARLTAVFEKHGTRGTWYAHASVGTLHVRPILDMRRDGALKMRAIAEEACAMVKQYKGAYSGEHGDGLVRSEWIAPFFGPRLTAALGEIKSWLDPRGLMNPGKIVNPTRMDDRSLFRFKPGYRTDVPPTALDWSEWGGYDKAVEMCNNNGHCRKFDAGTMCPSFRVTGDEMHLTRGRANTLRLALSGQLGDEGEEAVKSALDLCVSCKGCKRECPTGVDMARMKIEFLAGYRRRHGLTTRERMVAYLPRYAPWAGRMAPLANSASALLKSALGFAAKRALPKWRRDYFADRTRANRGGGREVVLFVDTFNRWFEPHNVRAAIRVLQAAGYRVHAAQPLTPGRPLCCGRTFLSAGLVEQAKAEARRTLRALKPWVDRGAAIIGLEPACLLSFRDEFCAMLPGSEVLARHSFLFEEFIARELDAGRFSASFTPLAKKALLHGHCHQKAFDAMPAVMRVLKLIPELRIEAVESSCCGMAGSFGYEAEHYAVSMKMAELSLLPAVRNSKDALVVADGTSCRHQIADGAGREAWHVARVLEQAL